MRKTIIPYNPLLKEKARELRKNGTMAEALLWRQLKGKQLFGYDFDRQKPLGNYIVDFFCNELLLAVEIDGYAHNFKAAADALRQQHLEAIGISFLRFTENDVRTNLQGVAFSIQRWIQEHSQK